MGGAGVAGLGPGRDSQVAPQVTGLQKLASQNTSHHRVANPTNRRIQGSHRKENEGVSKQEAV
jgi:hypothetical protein